MSNISRGSDFRTPTSVGEPEKVTSWPFKEPEKKSAWDDDKSVALKDVGIRLVDFEKENAEKRTALIRERMSPPGALRLPELLEAQRLKYGIPDGFFKSQAAFDRIYVFPIDQFDGESTIGGTGIHRTASRKLQDMQEGNRGVLISAGLTAADRLASHGIELGHVVTTNKNVPFARRCERFESFEMFYLVMREADLAGSETLADELRAGTKRVEDVGGHGAFEHQVAWNDNGEWTTRKKASVYIADAW